MPVRPGTHGFLLLARGDHGLRTGQGGDDCVPKPSRLGLGLRPLLAAKFLCESGWGVRSLGFTGSWTFWERRWPLGEVLYGWWRSLLTVGRRGRGACDSSQGEKTSSFFFP